MPNDGLDEIRELALNSEGRDGDLLTALGDRADLWAAAFTAIAEKRGLIVDEGWMVTWFANAIEHSSDIRIKQGVLDAQ